MSLSNIRVMMGATVCYARVDSSDLPSSISARGLCWSASSEEPTISDSVSTGYWDSSCMYEDIYYADGLTPSTKYYFRVYVTGSDGTTQYSPTKMSYTTAKGLMTYSYGSTVSGWETQYAHMQYVIPVCANYMNNAGLIPTCSFTARRNSGSATASFASNTGNPTSGNYMNFYNDQYINTETTLHELGHFMDYDFGAGLSFQDYPDAACGRILGKWMDRMSEFWFNFKGARTLCSSTHTFPYTEYTSIGQGYGEQDDALPFIDELHRAAAMFNSIKGYDGFVGVANCMYLTPRYSVEDGTYYIKGRNSGLYLSDDNGALTWTSSLSDACKWAVQFYPDKNALHTVINTSTGRYIDPSASSSGLNATAAYVQLTPTIHDDADGNDTHAILMGYPTSTSDSTRYGLGRTTLTDYSTFADGTAFNSNTYMSEYKPRKNCFGFTFIAAE